jgi:hypothetical protein
MVNNGSPRVHSARLLIDANRAGTIERFSAELRTDRERRLNVAFIHEMCQARGVDSVSS